MLLLPLLPLLLTLLLPVPATSGGIGTQQLQAHGSVSAFRHDC
jgi:hypothetical protein